MSDGVISKIQLPNENTYDIVDNTSGYITGMTILSYGSSTWNDFITAYNANKVVYCRASSNSNPASGSQTRLAFMAYVNNATTPTEVEFQYYRSVSSHSDSQQGDQVYVYKINSAGTWSVTVREAYSKIAVSGDLSKSYSNGTLTLSATIPTVPTNVSAFTNDAGYLTSYTETDPIFTASAAHGILASDITNWNSKQAALVSGTNIKTINNISLLGSGNISIQSGLQNLVDGSATGSVRGIGTAEEDSNYTIGIYAFVEGSSTMASGDCSHAEGSAVIASGDYTHAQNYKTIAQRKSQTTIGEYNVADTTGADGTVRGSYAFIIGNGTANNARSNALTVDWSGNVDIASGARYKINGTNLSASDVGAQPTLISGTNIKTINNTSLLGSGNISIGGTQVQIVRW